MRKGPSTEDVIRIGIRNGHHRNGDIGHGQIVQIFPNALRRFGAKDLHYQHDDVAEKGGDRCQGVEDEYGRLYPLVWYWLQGWWKETFQFQSVVVTVFGG